MQGSPGVEPPPLPRGIWGIALILLVVGLLPYRLIVRHFPWKIDAIKWVTRSASDSPGWMEWVFADTHFVGYRPVTAFSFTLNHLLGGWTPEVYRLTDLGLHLGVGLTTLALFRRLTQSANVFVLLPVLVLALHPAIEETLPYLPRRSYLLAALFGTGALCAWLDAVHDADRRGRKIALATGLLVLALLSNEVAYVLLPMFPILAWHLGASPREVLRRTLIPVLAALPCIAVRFAVLGWAGGYEKHYFAFARNGNKTLRTLDGFNIPEIVGASFDYLFFPLSFQGADPITRQFGLLTFLIVAFYTFASVFEPLAALHDRARRLPLLLSVWLFGYGLLYGLSRTWFWRQAYPMVLVLGLLVGAIAYQTWVQHRGWQRVLRFIPQVLLLVSVTWHSPVFRGMTTSSLAHRIEGNNAIHAFDALLDDVKTPVRAYLVLPLNKTSNRNVITWMNKVRPAPDHQFLLLATGRHHKPIARFEGNHLVLESGASFTATYAARFKTKADLAQLMEPGVTTGVLLPDASGAWTWVELH